MELNVKKWTSIIAFVMVVAVLGAATACQKADNSNSNANKATNGNSAATPTQAPPIMTPEKAGEPAAAGSPTAAYKAAYAARKNKDVDALRKLMSKDIMEFFVEIGKEEKKSVDEMLKELCDKPQAATDDTRNEKINGDRATVEYLDEDGKWRTMDFIKEGGSWKLTLPKMDDPESESNDDNNEKKPGAEDDK